MVCRREQNVLRFTHLPIIIGANLKEYPAFDSVLRGPGPIRYWSFQCRDQRGKWVFLVGLKFKAGLCVNATLLRLYPFRAFALDVAAVRIGYGGRVIPLTSVVSRVRAVMAIQWQVARINLARAHSD